LVRFLGPAGILLAALVFLSMKGRVEAFSLLVSKPEPLVEVKVHRLIIDPASNQPVVILADFDGDRALPIWIGFFEANAISNEIQGVKQRRPMTHDLLGNIMERAGLRVTRVVVTQLKESTYFATITVEGGQSLLEIDARPSDSIVMALKCKAPIFVSENLFSDKAIPLGGESEIEKQYGLTVQELTSALAEAFSFESTRGVLVSDVLKGSHAEKDGIERGDIVAEIGGRGIDDVAALRSALGKGEETLEARIFRKSQFVSVTLHPNR